MENEYYTYAYLSINRRPYYIGMGSGDRAYKPHPHMDVCMPDRNYIIILKRNLTQEQAWDHEKYMIAILDGLVNKTKGGSGWGGGCPATKERKRKISMANRGRTLSPEHKQKLSKAKKGVKQTSQAVVNRSRAVQRSITLEHKDTGEIITFASGNEAAAYLQVDHSTISHLRRGKIRTVKSFSIHCS